MLFRSATEGGPGSGPQKGGKKQSSADIKKAYGILNDPRYKQGNYSGAAKAIDKLSPGLSNHPDVKNAMKRANEELDETMVVTKVDKDTNSPAYQKFKAGDKRYVYKEESQITEKKAEFLRLDFKNKNEVEKLEGWMYKFISQVNAPYDSVVFNKHRLDGFSVEFEGMDDADALMTKLKRAGFRFKVDMRENLDLPATGDTTTSNASQELDEIVDTTEGFDMGNIRPRDSMGNRLPFDKYPKPKAPKAIHIPVPTMDYVGSKTEASFSKGQMDALVKGFGPLGGSERNKIKMDKVADILKKLPKDALMQLSKANLPMVSKVAKQLSEIGTQSYGSGYKSGYKGGIGVSFMDRNRELSRKYASAASKVAKIPMGPKKL